MPTADVHDLHHSSVVMAILLVLFAVIHSGGAALRSRAEAVIGARAWRLVFASASIPSAVVVIGWFLAHRYDGVRLWNLQGVPGIIPVIWVGTAISFLFLYPATYNLLEIPAVLKPQVRLYASGIIRISRHPQAVGQILWCLTHALWIGSSFMVVTCLGLIGHHLFAVWHGDRRLKERFGDAFDGTPRQHIRDPFPGRARWAPTVGAVRVSTPGTAGHCHRRGRVLVGAPLHRCCSDIDA